MKKIDYAWWKKTIWRFARVFIAAFLVVVAANIGNLDNFESLWGMVLYPAVIAGISALAKSLREYFAAGDYDNLLHKLPI